MIGSQESSLLNQETQTPNNEEEHVN